jgi:hypothetical protein
MAREIDILKAAVRKGCAVVEKDTHALWTAEELTDVTLAEPFQAEDRLLAPDPVPQVTGVFPGCPQGFSRAPDLASYRPVGQTAHFVILVPPEWR